MISMRIRVTDFQLRSDGIIYLLIIRDKSGSTNYSYLIVKKIKVDRIIKVQGENLCAISIESFFLLLQICGLSMSRQV